VGYVGLFLSYQYYSKVIECSFRGIFGRVSLDTEYWNIVGPAMERTLHFYLSIVVDYLFSFCCNATIRGEIKIIISVQYGATDYCSGESYTAEWKFQYGKTADSVMGNSIMEKLVEEVGIF